ncbi:glycosyltransferase family 9 protein [Mucilaginibacter glaciei]|uniref:Glycosyltransferase family 9 protein n=1 Tax=Mucilaginibacter glaciei TaxID=2772109 RepID=A0A926S042_9SPHI|nr:glycosyltransferase family 9 protein [Mucilaginibacter glaciei]MBD1392530.1 glycosyltransferase family 9 protein [Mucilaginibacter glaciei]
MAPVSNLKSNISNLKILIRLPNWLGDVVMSTAFVRAVKQFYPDATVDIIIKQELASIAALIPGVNRVFSFSKKQNSGLSGVFHFGKALRKHQYDIFFNLPHSLSSAVLAWSTRAKKRVGFNKEGGFFLMTRSYKKPLKLHRVEEYLSLLENFTGQPVTDKQVNLNSGQCLIFKQDAILINFNSEATSRRMPMDKGRKLITNLLAAFKGVTLVFVGAPAERDFIDEMIEVVDQPNRLHNYAGKTDLQGLVNLMAGCKVVLSTDSGPAHLANSIGVPTVVLFGAGDENNTAPYNKKVLSVLRYGQLECEPCVRNTCELYGVPKCMELLDEIKIINALSLHLKDA